MRNPLRQKPSVRAPGTILAYDLETIAPQVEDGSFPPWPTHRIVAAGFAAASCRSGDWSFDIDAMVVGAGGDEAPLVIEADRRMGGAGTIASVNGRGFDSLVLRLAAQRCRLWDLKALADHASCPRFDHSHADLADLYASFGRKVSLVMLCDAIGIPAKTSVDGSEVEALWSAGETEVVRQYVAEDATATLCLYLAWAAGRAADEALITRSMGALARHIEATPNLAHLHAFVDCALARWARPRAMRSDIGAALERVTARLRCEADERAFAAP